jgi:twitching motility two-component system response regulator PilG
LNLKTDINLLHEKTIISHIGLPAREVVVIRSLFSLVRSLQDGYTFVDSEKLGYADLVFVNSDDRRASEQWQAIASNNKCVAPVMVTAGNGQVDAHLTLHRPLSVRKLLAVLHSVTSTLGDKRAVRNHRAETRILVVDDSFPVRKYMEHKLPELAPESVIIDFAETGEEAKKRLEVHNYDMVFLDVVMPGIDGYKLCKWIKAKHPCYVVILTSRKSPFDKVRGTLSGCDDYLTKPPEDDRLRVILHKRLARQQTDVLRAGVDR